MKIFPRISLFPALLCAGLLLATGANAALQSQLGGQTLYDTDLNIVWLADANYAKTSRYDADGLMTWAQAKNWIAALNAEEGVGHLGFNDWRLPTSDASCPSTSCPGSEMWHLFNQELGGVAHNANYALFQNIKPWYYWSGTADGSANVWSLDFTNGKQVSYGINGLVYAMAVRPVPEPENFVLMLAGLGVIGAVARRRRTQSLRHCLAGLKYPRPG
jgi:hypothetical protein